MRHRQGALAAVAVGLLALVAGALASVQPLLGAASVLGVALIGLVATRPQWGAYLYAATTPLIVGVTRGSFLPGIRLNEALVGLIAIALVLRALILPQWLKSAGAWRPTDRAVIGLVLFSSVVPLAWMVVRSRSITSDDLAYALQLAKFATVFAVFRLGVRRTAEARVCLFATLGSCALSAVIGLLQAIGVAAVRPLLSLYIEGGAPKLQQLHASSTIGSPLAFADVMTICLAACVAFALTTPRLRALSVAGTVIFALAALASGEFSAILGLVVVVLILGSTLGQWRRLLGGAFIIAAASLPVIAPVLGARLMSIDPTTGLPTQWTGSAGRWTNLTQYVWPQISKGYDWLLGVRTSARIPSPYHWRAWIYIESGYSWAIWAGGVPLLIIVAFYFRTAIRDARQTVLCGWISSHPVHVLGVATLAGLAEVATLMVLDPHLTMRGSADLLFSLVAMCGSLIQGRELPLSHGVPPRGVRQSRDVKAALA